MHALLNGLNLTGAARRRINIALVAARRLVVVLVLGPPRGAPCIEVTVAVEVVERRLAERAEATTGCGRREHPIHTICIVAYLTTVTRQKGDRVGTVRPGAVAGAEGLVRERGTGVVRAVRIAGADRITRVMLSIVATPP